MGRIASARNAFPRGLWQPAGAYRFGADALLLGAFAAQIGASAGRRRGGRQLAAEVGSGCGAAIFVYALMRANAIGVGLEREEKLTQAARYNAMLLGLGHRLGFMQCDVGNARDKLRTLAGKMDLALANPPWHAQGAGRQPLRKLRQGALHGNALAVFCNAARLLLRWHGHFCLILRPEMLCAACAALAQCQLGLKTILPLCAHAGEAASRLLLMARKEAAAAPALLPMLALHEADGAFTQAALEFCPYLAKRDFV